jgi:predicted metal-dependent hydrolase
MSTETHQIVVSGVTVQVIRKAIKNLHLGVYPPNGRVRVAAPLRVSDNAVRLAVVDKLGWIKRQRAKFDTQPRQSVREMVSGESHFVFGRRYRLRVIHGPGAATVKIRGRWIEMCVRQGASAEMRSRLLQGWYRQRLRERALPLVLKWQHAIGVHLADWDIRRMKTKWGTCNPNASRIWLNLELAKKPVRCLEYLIVHELVHLIERTHNDQFLALMDDYLPDWRSRRTLLNAQPLAHDAWGY